MRDENAEESADWFPLRIDCPPCGRRQCRDLPDLQHLRASFLTAGFRGFGCCGYQLMLIMFTRLKLATLISAALFATAFGLYVNDRLIMFEEMINKIYGMTEQGAILWVVLMVFGLMLVGFAAVTYAAFRDDLSTAIKS